MNARSERESAEQKLARSRHALFQHVNRNLPTAPTHRETRVSHVVDGMIDQRDDPYSRDHSPISGWKMAKRAASVWWDYHPARTALGIAEPVLANYAERHPWKLLGVSAGIGAAAYVVKPWRLVSMTGLVIATLRSSHLSAVVASLVTPQRPQEK